MRRLSLLMALAMATLAACSGGGGGPLPGSVLIVRATDNRIVLDHASVASGETVVTIVNTAAIAHSIDLIKTDIPDDRLPPDPKDGTRVLETDVVKSFGVLQPGASLSVTLTLAKGKHVLLCAQPAHYLLGMHVPLTVE